MANTQTIPSMPQGVRSFCSDDDRWQAVLSRDPSADGLLFYSVKTTGVYCRPACPARLPLRKNVQFHSSSQAAEAAGFRPCRRCRPTEPSLPQRQSAAVAHACRLLEGTEQKLSLDELSRAVGVSPYHFHRLFKSQTGLTPHQYAAASRNKRLRQELIQSPDVTTALHRAGFNSSNQFYEHTPNALGMTPSQYRSGGQAAHITFATGQCWLGTMLVAATERGVCALLLGDDSQLLIQDLHSRFPNSTIVRGDHQFDEVVAMAIQSISAPAESWRLPLDIRGTAFQHRVWEALRKIPAGSTATYSEIARRIGQPTAARAVAHACAANAIAIAIPCHRVVRSDGSLSGYRWGLERKGELLRREQESAPASADQPAP